MMFKKLIALKKETAVFSVREYWLDIGQLINYNCAKSKFREFRD